MKKIILCSIGVLAVICASVYLLSNNKSVYNENPDVSYKIVGSEAVPMERMTITDMNEITSPADLIIIGEVISTPTDTIYEMPYPNENMKKSANSDTMKVTLACSQIKISEILHGKSKSDIITLAQFGSSSSDNGETKVKKGNKMLMTLKRYPNNENMYSSTQAEEGLFTIDNNKTLSLSNNKFTSRYDGIDISILKKDIAKGKKKQ